MSTSNSASYVACFILKLIRDRIGSLKPSYFYIDSAPDNTKAVHMLIGESGDKSWFPCAIYFVQLARLEAVQHYLNGSKESFPSEDTIYDSENEEYPLQQLKNARIRFGDSFLPVMQLE